MSGNSLTDLAEETWEQNSVLAYMSFRTERSGVSLLARNLEC